MKYILIVLLLLAGPLAHAVDVELLQSTVVDENAINFSSALANFNRNINGRTYQRFPMATLNGYQYATFYDINRNVCLGRRKLPVGTWEVIRFTDYEMPKSDSHNVVAVGICAKDGTIHLAFDHHANPLNYRVSVVGAASNPDEVAWNADLFGSVTDRLGAVGYIAGVTYPTFFSAPNGNLMLYYRSGGSGNGDGMIHEYDGTTHDWTVGLGKFISRAGNYTGAYTTSTSTTRCPYINGISYGGDRLHASWGWRETSVSAASNHDLNYAYSDDNGRTWYNSAGTQIGVTGSSFISIDSPGLIVADIPQNEGLSNQYTHYAYPDGRCHVMVAHNGKYQHYWRDTSGGWHHGTLGFVGSRPKLAGDDDGNLFLVFQSGNKPQIAKGVPNAAQTAWNWSLVHTQSDTSEGGEGQLDYSRWETDRILSFYGQETPSSTDEVPSALHVIDYKVSSKAVLPIPANHAQAFNVGLTLEWTAGIDAVSHRIYFGTNEQSVAEATTASPEYLGEQSSAVFTPSPMPTTPGIYYWRVDEVKTDSTVITGMIWQFELIPFDGVVPQIIDQGTWDVASTWDPAGIPVEGVDYETSMQLRTPVESATFGGGTLTVRAGGELALRNIGSNVVTVDNLILDGGNIRAGTGNNITSTLAGCINVLTNADLVGYWNDTGPRNLRIQSRISGNAELRSLASNSASTHTLFIDNPTNDFSGTWVSQSGIIEFASPGSVGPADINVLAEGKLTINGSWDGRSSGAVLTVADSPDALVDLGANEWTVAEMTIGGLNVAEGTYTVSELNALGGNAVFAGAGAISVGLQPPKMRVAQVDGDFMFSWSNSTFKLQYCTNLMDGAWTDYEGGTSSPVSVTPTNSAAFFRLIEQ